MALNFEEYKGLTQTEVETRLRMYGENRVEQENDFSLFKLGLQQFASPMIYVLLAAMLITMVLGDYVDTVVIALAVLVNTALGFWQEYKAEKSLEKLASVIMPRVVVWRDGDREEIEVSQLVPGDIVMLESGERIPADGVLVEADEVAVDEALLTGESVPVNKKEVASFDYKKLQDQDYWQAKFVSLEDRKGEAKTSLYAGTLMAKGSAKMLVVATGSNTEMGQIAFALVNTQDEETPLQQKLGKFSQWLAVLVGAMALGIFLVGIFSGKTGTEMFALSVAIAVSAIPEGLVVALTAILAIGMQRILKKKALVRKLVAAEVLGSVTVICTDKTGTITEGKLRVGGIDMVDDSMGMTAMLTAADLTDPMEVAMWEWAQGKMGEVKTEKVMEDYPRLDRVPFSSERKYSATLTEKELFIVGAPELVLKNSNLTKMEKQEWLDKVEKKAKAGYRMVGIGHRRRGKLRKVSQLALDKQWKWLGLVEYKDQVREGVSKALKSAIKAGMEIKVITGDYGETAMHVMRELGLKIEKDEVMDGEELKGIDGHELDERMEGIRLFARTSPAQKLKIVDSLQRLGEVVAMTGDGVNDAPALKKADIGIVVSSASDVAKETADMVLLNDDFSTVIAAVEEGRGIYENLRKVLLYLLSDSFSEILIIAASLILGWPMPITAAQILWVNLVNDGLPNLALTMEPKDDDLLDREPRDPDAPIVDRDIAKLMGIMSVISATVIMGMYGWILLSGGEVEYARTMAFLLLGIDSLVYVFSCRSLTLPVWKVKFLSNPWLIGSVIVGVIIMALAVYLPILQSFLGTVSVGLTSWVVVFGLALFELVIVEISKMLVFRNRKT